MIIKGNKRKRHTSFIPFFILMGLAIAILGASRWSKKETVSAEPTTIICGAEVVEGKVFVSDNKYFSGAKYQSDKKYYEGNYSVLLNSPNATALRYRIPFPKVGMVYKASVWKYGNDISKGYLVAEGPPGSQVLQKEHNTVERNEEWWNKIELFFAIPTDSIIDYIDVFVSNEGDQEIYFDQLIIKEHEHTQTQHASGYFNQRLHLLIEQPGLDKLKAQRQQAIRDGVFIRGEDSELEAAIVQKDKNHKISLRYKGDWLDHILPVQASYRIECASGFSWNGMQSFSIQHPRTRGYLREWVYHDLLTQEEVLSPRYDFVLVGINGAPEKVYALEEHFNKNLVEYKKRREGPILKMTEEEFWEGTKRYINEEKGLSPISNKNRAFWNSDIVPFKLKRTQKDSTLSKQFAIAQNLVYRYKIGEGTVDETFDLDKMARFMAISELCLADHSLTWHNQRFYYNPVISLLEPVGYDCSVIGDKVWAFERPLFIEKEMLKRNDGDEPVERIFQDKAFLTKFFNYLDSFSTDNYVKSYLATRERDISQREQLLRSLKKDYNYDRNELIDRAKKIRITIHPYLNALKVFKTDASKHTVEVSFINTHALPLEVKMKDAADDESFIVLPRKDRRIPNYFTREISARVQAFMYRLPGAGEWQEAVISPWTPPSVACPRVDLFTTTDESDTTLFTIQGQRLTMKRGIHDIDRRIIIPAGYEFHIGPQTALNFAKDGCLLSASPVYFKGSPEYPIVFRGDGSNGALVVLQAGRLSRLQHVRFENQNTFSYKGWKLTGAVSFYESDVDIQECQFLNNTCEDALNIIRSDFEVNRSYFANIYSDAFDADFCNGTLKDSGFKNTGNDAIDFSTSVIEARNCTMVDIGDKAISAGEQATVDGYEIHVTNANIAFASKDKSVLTLYDVSIKSCKQGFTAYQKKPEFGPATIQVIRFQEEDIDNLFLIEAGSTLLK